MILERAIHALEFDKIRNKLTDFATTSMGKKYCNELAPITDVEAINKALVETEEAKTVLYYSGANPMFPFTDISDNVSLAQKGACLSTRSLLNVASCLRASRSVYKALITDKDNTPNISKLASGLTLLVNLEQNITESILGEDELADNASTELANIRRKLRHANSRIKDKLNSLIKSPAYQKYLQDPIITIRQDRFVVPVKQEYRANVPGLIHDQSSSGATLFIEPMVVVEINNDIKQLLGEERIEIERILQMFSDEVGSHAEELKENVRILIKIDFNFAKASFARSINAILPKINTRGYINIVRGRHPLLNPDTVVPINLWLGEDFTSLVVTGPNTGGKTVTLKTVGLFTLMMQSGLHVPADEGTELAIFNNVYADIGDEQSIEQSLSTFSSHMKNIVEILKGVSNKDLVLFDELGAGTDPTEGAALAQSILSKLLESNIRTLATTHFSELKSYALSTPGIENASVEFNIETLSPTFRLSIGIPGKSNAFEISKKLGLSEDIINSAKELLSSETVKFEDVISNAEYHRQIAEKERAIAEEVRKETIQLRDEAERLRKKTEESRANTTRKAKEEAKRIMLDAKHKADEILSDLKKMKNQANLPHHEILKLQKSLNDNLDSLSADLVAKNDEAFMPPKELSVGDRVLIVNLNTEADVLSPPDSKGEVQLKAGIMKLKAHISQLKKLKNSETPQQKTSINIKRDGSSKQSLSLEVDVRGMALDEATVEVDSYLYQALMVGYKEVYIIHGKGTGVLKAGISKHLKNQKHVKSFRLGRYGEGEDGVTVVTLK